ncbi:AAA family ATPase [Hymenobacter sp. BT186]|uniref:AAA family ATPase n=1 Tax=Hymenobacter telluris TaxID=2816474 RepID=A0A939JBK6_9BACT|nr:AAA family ATPase [Hymenobacter telluris]MBO0356367.1 AAA family ATPase [Hymenobacter telluris]MBW3372391.1 ATP-binding protein [Hymenobacter norwichensis]
MHSGILRLREVNLSKINTNRPYSIIDASSGEQSVVIGFLGIASQIKDNSLICIDEPEICLHPEWQEKYIKLLLDTFKHYKGCHFLIATHSPQIISNLDTNNCFVLSMDTGKITNADSLINNSIDFQLANVFKSPGFKNEYLSRIALSVFTKVSSKKQFDNKDTENYTVLISQENFLDREDPVYTLLLAIKKLHKLYARN